MATTYIKVQIGLLPEKQDMAVAFLAALGFDGFELLDELMIAYINIENFRKDLCYEALAPLDISVSDIQIEKLLPKNWNEEWEKQYDPVQVDDFCQIITTFHSPKGGYKHTLIIEPQMSFGTGHHETTRLMIRQMSGMVFENKIVLEMGSGTGILSILAAKMNARKVIAIDIDTWSEENSRSNIKLNHTPHIEVLLGDVECIPPQTYDAILANINRNVLLSDIPQYVSFLSDGGELLISGFYLTDEDSLISICRSLSLKLINVMQESSWSSIRFKK